MGKRLILNGSQWHDTTQLARLGEDQAHLSIVVLIPPIKRRIQNFKLTAATLHRFPLVFLIQYMYMIIFTS